jgi:hypothetical protein
MRAYTHARTLFLSVCVFVRSCCVWGVGGHSWYCAWQEDRPDYCNNLLEASFQQREADAARMGVPKMLTEFGHLYGTADDRVRNNTAILDRAAQDWVSWTTWEIGALTNNAAVAASLVRPYARAIAGEPVRATFDPAGPRFVFEYLLNPAIAAPTEVFVPRTLHYTGGVNITVTPAASVRWSQPQPHLLWIEPAAGASLNERVTVTITPAP